MLHFLNRSRCYVLTCLAILTVGLTSYPQDAPRQRGKQTQSKGNSSETKLLAISSLEDIAFKLRNLKDHETLPARASLADQLIKLLLPHNPEKCRELLDFLFAESLEELQIQQPKQQSGPGNSSNRSEGDSNPRTAINAVIHAAMRVDPKLAESYIAKYLESEKHNGSVDGSTVSDYYMKMGTAAIDLSTETATAMAQKSFEQNGQLNINILPFLRSLQEKDGKQCDQFLRTVIQQVRNGNGKNVNDLLLLYSYVFSINSVPIVSNRGLGIFYVAYKYNTDKNNVLPETVRFFLQTISDILLNNARYDSNFTQLTWGAQGDVLAIGIVEGEVGNAYPSLGSALRERQRSISSYLGAEGSSKAQGNIDKYANSVKNLKSKSTSGETVDSLLDNADKATDPDKKDLFYVHAAYLAVQTAGFDKAIDIASKVSSRHRKYITDLIRFTIAKNELGKGDLDQALEWARKSDDLVQQAYLLTLVGQSLNARNPKDADQVVLVLRDVEALVPRIDNRRERVSVQAGLAVFYSKIDQDRAFQLLQDAVSDAKKIDTFSGQTNVERTLLIGNEGFSIELYGPELSLLEAFAKQKPKDFAVGLSLADSLQLPLTRIRATLALCRGFFEQTT